MQSNPNQMKMCLVRSPVVSCCRTRLNRRVSNGRGNLSIQVTDWCMEIYFYYKLINDICLNMWSKVIILNNYFTSVINKNYFILVYFS